MGLAGGALKLAYSDCGDKSTHGKFTSLSPTTVILGTKTPLKGKGTVDEDIQGASYEVEAKALFVTVFKHTGNACKAESIKLPAGAGTIDMHGFQCPLARGDVELDLDLSLAGSIPSLLARLTIDLKATTSTGDKALCAQIKTSPARRRLQRSLLKGVGAERDHQVHATRDGTSARMENAAVPITSASKTTVTGPWPTAPSWFKILLHRWQVLMSIDLPSSWKYL